MCKVINRELHFKYSTPDMPGVSIAKIKFDTPQEAVAAFNKIAEFPYPEYYNYGRVVLLTTTDLKAIANSGRSASW